LGVGAALGAGFFVASCVFPIVVLVSPPPPLPSPQLGGGGVDDEDADVADGNDDDDGDDGETGERDGLCNAPGGDVGVAMLRSSRRRLASR
jgi:hypothetical protein